jgi:hypothetical membrane protein
MFTQRNGCLGSISSTLEFTSSCALTKARPLRKAHRVVDLISDALPFGRLCYGEPNAVSSAIDSRHVLRFSFRAVALTFVQMTSPHSGINTNILLACGIIAGPLFVFMFLVEGAVRPNYNACRQPVSDLAIGEFGSIQITNFIITGLLFLAFTIGLRRTSLALSVFWGPFILGVFSVGLIGAGIFTGDQHPLLHGLCSIPVFFGLPIACFVFARVFVGLGKRGWAAYSTFTGIVMFATFVLSALGFGGQPSLVNFAGVFQRLSIIVGWTWLTLLAIHLLRCSYGASDGRLRSPPA